MSTQSFHVNVCDQSGVAQSGSVSEDTARYSVITGARLLSVDEIREHGRAARQHIANADAALARAGLSLREAERISDEVLGERVVSDEEADRVADELVGPVLSTPVQQFYCRCGCGSKVSAYNAALDYALLGLSATNAVESVACHYGLTELEQELMVEEIEEEVADRIRMGRMAP